jgi:hypothetical protein
MTSRSRRREEAETSASETIGNAPSAEPDELPPWQAFLGILVFVAFLAAALISICFLAAKLATGHAT